MNGTTNSSSDGGSLECTVFGVERREGTYVYVREDEQGKALENLPDQLRDTLGPLREVMNLELTARRKLAAVDVGEVMRELAEKGFYLQMPPAKEDYLLDDVGNLTLIYRAFIKNT